MTTSFYTDAELVQLGLKNIGTDVLISRKASIYGADNIQIGSHVRIDDFCILSGLIKIGNYIHIAAYSALYSGDAGIEIADFANISSRVSIYAISDDYSGESMTNPMLPNCFKRVQKGKVVIQKHAIIGCSCVILPNVVIEEGSAVGSMSLVKNDVRAWTINVGIPCREIKTRSRKLLELAEAFTGSEYKE